MTACRECRFFCNFCFFQGNDGGVPEGHAVYQLTRSSRPREPANESASLRLSYRDGIMQYLMNIMLIIFDLDGTLIDTASDITHALNYSVQPYLRRDITVEETIKLVGEGITRLIEKLLGQDRAELGPVVQERFLQYYTEHLYDYSQPYPGVRETLEELHGYKKAVLSNKREVLSRRLLDALKLSSHFDIILGSNSVEEKKPSPRPVVQILEMLSLRPENAVMVGDSDYDVEAGRRAGVSTIAVSYGYRDVSVLRKADVIIDDIRDLPQTISTLESAPP